MATINVRYVNPASAGGDGTSTALSGGSAAFSSLSASIANIYTTTPDLISANIQYDIQIDGTGSDISLAGFTFNNIAADATRYIRIRITPGNTTHAGQYNSSIARTECQSAQMFNSIANNTRFENLQFVFTHATYAVFYANAGQSFTGITFTNCLFHSQVTTLINQPQVFGIFSVIPKNISIVNCIVTGRWYVFGYFQYFGTGSAILYNNTVSLVSGSVGMDFSGNNNNTIYCKNNIVQVSGSGTCYNLAGTPQLTSNNLSSDATSPDGSTFQNKLATFIDVNNGNVNLNNTDTTARGNGADLSADGQYAFNTDARGVTRPQGPTWDIGALEWFRPYVTGSPSPITATMTQQSSTGKQIILRQTW